MARGSMVKRFHVTIWVAHGNIFSLGKLKIKYVFTQFEGGFTYHLHTKNTPNLWVEQSK